MLEFRVLGPLEVRRDGRSVEVRGSKRRALLALLVLQANEIVRTDLLIDALWGEHQPANASAALQSHISRLRKDLGEGVLVTKPWGYVLRASAASIDLRRFEQLVREARPLPARERDEMLGAALSLWHGGALADLASEPSLSAECARLEELRESVVEQRIDAQLELGEHEEVIPVLEGLVAAHPLRERLRGQLILALYRAGSQAEALETYRETRRLLVEELGIEPSPELRELERAILRQDPSLTAAPVPAAIEHNVRPSSRWRWPRSPLIAGAAALLLALAGLAVAILANPTSGTSHAGTAPSSPPSAAATTSESTSVTHHTAATTNHLESTLPDAKPRPPHKQEARPLAHNGTTTTANPSPTTVKPPRQHQPAPPSKPKPPRLKPQAYWISDDFTDPSFDPFRWHVASHGTGVEVAERNERLEFSIAPDVAFDDVYGVDQHYGSQCSLTGDFDARVDFALLTWPAENGVFVQLGVWFPPPSEGYWVASRQSAPYTGGTDAYSSNFGSNVSVRTTDLAGGLRVRRVNGVLTTYYRHGSTWIQLSSARNSRPSVPILELWTTSTLFGHQAAQVAFDNFQATARAVQCPGVPLPPRKSQG